MTRIPLRLFLAHGFDEARARASALREASDDELIGELARRGRWLLEQPEAEREREDATAMERQAERDLTSCSECEAPFGCEPGGCVAGLEDERFVAWADGSCDFVPCGRVDR